MPRTLRNLSHTDSMKFHESIKSIGKTILIKTEQSRTAELREHQISGFPKERTQAVNRSD